MSSQEVLIILLHAWRIIRLSSPHNQIEILLMIFICFQHSLVRTLAVKHTVFIAWPKANETFRLPYAVMYWFWWMNFNHSFNNISVEAHTPGNTFLELILFSLNAEKHKKKSPSKALKADLMCDVAHKNRKGAKGQRDGRIDGYLCSFDSDI